MLYDGECPLCNREVDMLRRRDAGSGKIDFVDVASPNYRAEDNHGVSYEQVGVWYQVQAWYGNASLI